MGRSWGDSFMGCNTKVNAINNHVCWRKVERLACSKVVVVKVSWNHRMHLGSNYFQGWIPAHDILNT